MTLTLVSDGDQARTTATFSETSIPAREGKMGVQVTCCPRSPQFSPWFVRCSSGAAKECDARWCTEDLVAVSVGGVEVLGQVIEEDERQPYGLLPSVRSQVSPTVSLWRSSRSSRHSARRGAGQAVLSPLPRSVRVLLVVGSR